MKRHEKEFVICLDKCNLDKACELVENQVIQYYLDENGHSNKFPDWDRSEHSIKISFNSMEMEISMAGRSYIYLFKAWISAE